MRNLLIILLMLVTGPAFAACTGNSFLDRLTPAERAELDAVVAATPYPTGLIFDAAKGEQQITLVGTLHLFDPRLDAIRARVADDIAAADVLLVEASPSDAASLEAHMAANPDMMFLGDGPTLPEMLTDETWARLSEAAGARQIPPFLAAKMQPWFLSLSLAIAPCAMAEMAAGKRGLDFHLMDDATAAGVPIRSLEHWSLVIDLMRADPLEEQVAALEMGLLPADLQVEMFVGMIDSYIAGDIVEVWEASRLALNYVPGLDVAEANTMFDDVEQRLLVDRNHDWMPVINDAMSVAERAVIAVGAAHMPGNDGLLRLLEAEGWTITPRP